MYFLKQKVFLKIQCQFVYKVPFLLNSHAANKSTAATYTERTISKKGCLNNLLYNSWKHSEIMKSFMKSFWNFVFCLSFISSNFPLMKISKTPFPHCSSPPLPPPSPLFFSPPSSLILKNFSFSQILLSLKIQSPFWNRYVWALVSIYVPLYVYIL